MNTWRGPFGVSLRACLRGVTLPAALATVAAALCAWLDAPVLADGEGAAAAVTPWLTLPLFVTAAGCSLVAARTWPTFSANRDGADTVRRIARGPLGGRGAVALGSVAAHLVLSLPLTISLAAGLEVPPAARRHVEAAAAGAQILDRRGATLTFALPRPLEADAVWLRPRASLPTGPEPTAVQVTSAGHPLSSAPVEFDESLELIQLTFDRRQVSTMSLTQTGGHVPLLFDAGSVVFVGASELPRWANAAALALLSCSASIVALLIAGLLGLAAGWPTVASTIVTAQFVQWIAGVGPIDDAILAFARGQWLL